MTTNEAIESQQATNRELWARENGRMHSVDANRLIAGFMGWDVYHNKCYSPKYNDGTIAPMQFHTSWDWLMPVAESCFERLDVTDTSASEIQRQLSVCDKAGAYEAIVEFIKTYQKKQL